MTNKKMCLVPLPLAKDERPLRVSIRRQAVFCGGVRTIACLGYGPSALPQSARADCPDAKVMLSGESPGQLAVSVIVPG